MKSILFSIGNQWRDFKIGLICSCLRERVTSLAAAFWTSWSFLIELLGRPYNKELQKSSLEEIKAWTRISQDATLREFLIFQMLCRWKKHDLQMEAMWDSKERAESKNTPILRTDEEGAISKPEMLIEINYKQ